MTRKITVVLLLLLGTGIGGGITSTRSNSQQPAAKFSTASVVVPSLPLAKYDRAPRPSAFDAKRRRTKQASHSVAFNADGRRPATAVEQQGAINSFLQLPLDFEANQGQAPKEVAFVAHGPGYALGLSPNVARLMTQRLQNNKNAIFSNVNPRTPLADHSISSEIQLQLQGANANASVSGLDPAQGQSNYFIGNNPDRWRKSIAHFHRVRMAAVYPGIDLVFYGNPRQLEYDFVLAPGADPNVIRWNLSGARAHLDTAGNVELHAPTGSIRLVHPVSYQDIDGFRKEVPSKFVLHGGHLSFLVSEYDHSKELVIDPVLVFSVALGSSDGFTGSSINSVEVDGSGNIYFGGATGGTDFPSTAGPFSESHANPNAVQSTVGFVAKMDAQASTLIYSDYVGGTGVSSTWYVAPDATGNLFVTGYTLSTDYPLVSNVGKTSTPAACAISPKPTYVCPNGFVYKLNADGSQMLFSSLIGGSQVTVGTVLQINPVSGELAVLGLTNSPDILPAPTTLQKNFTGATCAPSHGACPSSFLLGLDPETGAVRYQTYLGGASTALALSLQIDSAGALYVTGGVRGSFSSSIGASTHNYAPTGGASGGGFDFFAMKLLRSAQNALTVSYLTTIQGEADDASAANTVDGSGNNYFIGSTVSKHLPVTSGVYQSTNNFTGTGDCGWRGVISPFAPNVCGNAFVGMLSPSGTLGFLTYLGGGGPDLGQAIGQDADGNLWLGGVASSATFPFSSDAYLAPSDGIIQLFTPYLAKMTNDGRSLPYATALSSGPGFVIGITAEENDIYVGGYASTVPTTPGVYPQNPQAFSPGFLQKWDAAGSSPALVINPTNLALADTPIGSVSPAKTATIQNTGAGPMEISLTLAPQIGTSTQPNDFVATNNCGSSLAATSSCTVTVTFAPGAPSPACAVSLGCSSGDRSAQLSVLTNAPGGPNFIGFSGKAGNGGTISVSPNPIVFPAQPAGTTSANTDVFISNNGDIALTVNSATTTGPNASEFIATLVSTGSHPCNTPVPSDGSTCQLEVAFAPGVSATGTRTAQLLINDNGQGSPQSIPLSGTVAGTGALNVSPSSINFAVVALGNSTTGGFTISNPGSSVVQVTGLAFSGMSAADFAVSSTSCGTTPITVPAGSSCFVGLSFTPGGTTRGLRTATVTATGPTVTGNPSVALRGNVVNNTDPNINLFSVPSPLDFGGVEVGQSTSSSSHILSISNRAPIPCSGGASSCGGALNISALTPGNGDYQVSVNGGSCGLPPLTINTGSNCLFFITFTPSAAGNRDTTLTIASNDPQGAVTVPLLGSGLSLPIGAVSPTILNFGASQTGVASPAQTITLQNIGKGPLGATTAAASTNFAVLSNNCNQTVAAGATCNITVTFTPPSVGAFTGTLTLTNNGAFGGKQIVALAGTGDHGALLAINPNSLTFADQPPDTTSLPQTVTLSNSGNAAVNFPTGAFRISSAYQIVSSSCAATLAVGANCKLSIAYTAPSPDPSPGTLTITDNAKGSPQPIYLQGSSPLSGVQTSTTTIASSANPIAAGQAITFTAHVTSTFTQRTPTGLIFFLDGAKTIGTAYLDATAHATFTTSALSGGTHLITASYGADSEFLASTSSALSQVVTGGTTPATTSTALSSSVNPSTVGQSVTFNATVSSATAGTITGTVTFKDGSTTLGTGTIAGGIATFATTSLSQGTHSVTAIYGGDSNFATSTSTAVSQVVNPSAKASTTTALVASSTSGNSGTSITFTATVSSQTAGNISGTVTFLDGGSSIGTGSVGNGGVATLSSSTLTAGAHSITASYAGDSNYASSTSTAVNVTVNAATADFTVAFNPASSTIAAGASATTTITVTPKNGYNSATTFGCSGLPTFSTCTFNPASVTPSGGAATSSLTIATNVGTGSLPTSRIRPFPPSGWYGAILSFVCLLALIATRCTQNLWQYHRAPVLVLLFGIFLGIAGCGGASHSTPPPPHQTAAGTYTVVVTVSGGGTTHQGNYTLTVQ